MLGGKQNEGYHVVIGHVSARQEIASKIATKLRAGRSELKTNPDEYL